MVKEVLKNCFGLQQLIIYNFVSGSAETTTGNSEPRQKRTAVLRKCYGKLKYHWKTKFNHNNSISDFLGCFVFVFNIFDHKIINKYIFESSTIHFKILLQHL